MTSHQLMLGKFAIDPRDMWETPQYLFDQLNSEAHFTVDACAVPDSAKMSAFWTKGDDGLLQEWKHHRVFCNPPYSAISAWVEKCKTAELACLLVTVSSDVAWWHSALRDAAIIDFFRGRIQFIPPSGIQASTCNGRHCLIWFGRVWREPNVRWRSRSAKTGVLL